MGRNYNRRTEKDYGLIRTIWYTLFVLLVVIPVSKLMYNLKIEGRENVPKGTKVIFAGNHVSYLDPPMMTYAVWKKVAYMGKKELFESPNKLLRYTLRGTTSDGTLYSNANKSEHFYQHYPPIHIILSYSESDSNV